MLWILFKCHVAVRTSCLDRRAGGWAAAVLWLAGVLPSAAHAVEASPTSKRAQPTCTFKAIKRGVVTDVLSATSLRLDTGRVLQLQSVLAPSIMDVAGGAPAWPIADQANAAVRLHLLGKNVRYVVARKRPDRYGRFAGHVWLADAQPVRGASTGRRTGRNRATTRSVTTPDRWVQRWMLAHGFARFAPHRDRSGCAQVLQEAELAARARRAGMWALDAYRVRPAWKYRELSEMRNTYQVVAGRVKKVSVVRGRTFINFGKNWRQDFTAAISKRQLRYFKRVGLEPKTLQGRRVEVRGWVEYRGGPYVEIEHTHQLRRLARKSSMRRQSVPEGGVRQPDPAPPAPALGATKVSQ